MVRTTWARFPSGWVKPKRLTGGVGRRGVGLLPQVITRERFGSERTSLPPVTRRQAFRGEPMAPERYTGTGPMLAAISLS